MLSNQGDNTNGGGKFKPSLTAIVGKIINKELKKFNGTQISKKNSVDKKSKKLSEISLNKSDSTITEGIIALPHQATEIFLCVDKELFTLENISASKFIKWLCNVIPKTNKKPKTYMKQAQNIEWRLKAYGEVIAYYEQLAEQTKHRTIVHPNGIPCRPI